MALLAALCLFAACPPAHPPRADLQVDVIGCAIVRADGSCVPDPAATDRLRFSIHAPQGHKFAFKQGRSGALRAHELQSDDDRQLIELDDHLTGGTVTVYEVDGTAHRERTIALREFAVPPWLAAAWVTRADPTLADGGKKARTILEQNQTAAAQLTGEAHARYLSIKARLAAEFEDPDWEQLLRQAIVANHDVGLLSEAAENALWLSQWLSTRQGRIAEAQQVLHDAQGDFARLPEWQAWEARQQALHLALRGALREALEKLETGRQIAQHSGNENALSDLNSLGAQLLASSGRSGQASRWLTESVQFKLSPCREIERLLAQVDVWLQLQEAEHAPPSSAALREPMGRITQALSLASRSCDQPRLKAQAYTYRARTALRGADFVLAAAALADARAQGVPGDQQLTVSWLALDGELALAQGRWADAQKFYTELRQRGRDTALVDVQWQAQLGLAQLAAARPPTTSGSKAGPGELFGEAERLADRAILAAPLNLGGGGYLERYERGTIFYYDWLLRHDRLTEALQVIRHARVRGIRAVAVLERLRHLPAAKQKEYEAALGAYQLARRALDQLTKEEAGAAADQLPLLREHHDQLSDKALQALEAVLKCADLAELASVPQRAPRPDEALLTCYPGLEHWVCLYQDAQGVKQAAVARAELAATQSPELLAQRLLQPFQAQLQRVKRLTVLAYGALREIDVHLLPLGPKGQPLYTQLEVVYGLDLPPAESAPAAPELESGAPSAYLLIDHERHSPLLKKTAVPIADSLRAAGYQPKIEQRSVAWHGGGVGQGPLPGTPLTSELVLAELPRPALLHIGAHVGSSKNDGWYPRLPVGDDAGVMVSDILALPRVPRFVTLFTCDSGRTDPEGGNLDGLGLAQAFVARGSTWVLGTTRRITPELAAAVSTAFYAAYAVSRDPVQALRVAIDKTRRELAQPLFPVTSANDLGAFRVYTP